MDPPRGQRISFGRHELERLRSDLRDRGTSSLRPAVLAVATLALAGACGDPAPRFGEATISAAAPRTVLTGTTFGQAAALELAPGCPGYLDPEIPGHVVHVADAMPFSIQARSEQGPLALALAAGDEVRCDSDAGSGHAPTITLDGPGDYQVFVAALEAPGALRYELIIQGTEAGAGIGAPAHPAAPREVSVTITSDPPGARVQDPSGRVVGTTPAMFVVSVPPDQVGQESRWTLALDGHADTVVAGTLSQGALVLHAQLPPTPRHIDVTADESQPIRDFGSASLAIEVAESCSITEARVGVDIRHSYRGDLRVVLRTPWSESITLHRHEGGATPNLQRGWDLSTASTEPSVLSPLRGRSTRGRWTLVVHDDASGDRGRLERFRLQLTCGAPGHHDVDENDPEVAMSPTPPNTHPDPPRRPPTPRLPDLPGRTEIVRVLSALRPRIEGCGTQGGNVRVIATVVGSTGRIREVSSSGSASNAERACVERIVRTARFPRFRRPMLDVDYTYDLPARGRSAPSGSVRVFDPWTGGQ